MPKEAKIIRGQVFAGVPFVALARISNLTNGEPLVAVDVSQVAYAVFDTGSATPETPIQSGSLVVADVVHALKRDARWGEDNIGYNFSYTVPASFFPLTDRTYALRFLFFTGGVLASAVLLYSIYVLATTG